MRIGVVGTGYVGLVSGACLAEFGNLVVCADKDENKIKSLQEGKVTVYEPGLEKIVKKNRLARRLIFTTQIKEAVSEMDAVFIAVGTPASRRGDGYADLSYIYAAAREIAPHINKYTVIINKSTVPIGTAEQVKRTIREVNPKADFDVVSNPEFLREGVAISDFMRPDRVVIGAENKKAVDVMKRVYKPLCFTETPLIITNPSTAELIKYASNGFLAMKISFINEMANLCEAVAADVIKLTEGMGLDKRIGPEFLRPGPGYGGSCFPKDTRALIRIAQEHGVSTRIIEAVVEVNSAQKARMVRKIRKALGGSEAGKTIAVLGLTFKPETDDMRESPSLSILPALAEKGARIKAHDPYGMIAAKIMMPEIDYVNDSYQACQDADCVVLMTEWNEYRSLDIERIGKNLKSKIFIDLRNVYEPETLKAKGFKYIGVGRN